MKQPSPIDFLRRWPRASVLLSALIMVGDAKHGDDGRGDNPGRGAPIDLERYDLWYSYDKLLRHMTRFFGGEYTDEETEVMHPVAVLWHAFNAVEAECERQGWTVSDLIDDYTDEEA